MRNDRGRTIALLGLAMVVAFVVGEFRLRTAPAVPIGLSLDEREFASGALMHSYTFVNPMEAHWLRAIRVSRVTPDQSADPNPSDGITCGICRMGVSAADCQSRYIGAVRFYTWANIPFAAMTVHCEGASR